MRGGRGRSRALMFELSFFFILFDKIKNNNNNKKTLSTGLRFMDNENNINYHYIYICVLTEYVCIQIILIMNITLRRRCDETNCWISTQSKNSIRGGFPRIARGCHYSIRKNYYLLLCDTVIEQFALFSSVHDAICCNAHAITFFLLFRLRVVVVICISELQPRPFSADYYYLLVYYV